MYSVVYVLTDTKKLIYSCDMFISICSLRKRNFTGNIFVLLDLDTRDILEKLKHEELEKFNVQLVVVDVPENYTKVMKSRYIKTSMRKWVIGDFLYLDTDTIVAGELPKVISEYDMAQVLEANGPFREMPIHTRNYHSFLHQRCGYDLWQDDLLYFNSGVIWAKDTDLTHRIFEEWHKKWSDYLEKRGIWKDQPALNQTNKEMKGVIQRLSDLYNVQVSGIPFPTQYLAEAKIIHYFRDTPVSPYVLSNKQVSTSDLMNPQLQQIIDAPRAAFYPGIMLKKNDISTEIMYSKLYSVLKHLYVDYPKLFSFGEKSCTFLFNLWKKYVKNVEN